MKVALIIYCIVVGYIGGFSLYIASEDFSPCIWYWKYLREELNLVGSIIIYIISLPAVLLTILCDLLMMILYIFYSIFKKKG